MGAASSTGTARRRKVPRVSSGICVVCALAVVALFYGPVRAKILKIEPWTADWRTVFLSDQTATHHPDIAVIIVSTKTLADYPYQTPTPRNLLAKLVRAVDAAGPRTIGVDFYFARETEKANDDALVEAVRKSAAPVVLGAIDRRHKQFREAEFDFQRRFLGSMGRPVGFIDLNHDADDVVRYTAVPADPDWQIAFATLVAETAGARIRARDASLVPARIAWLRGPGDNADPFLTIPAEDLLAEQASAGGARPLAEQLKGKVVLISGEYPYLDRHRTPLSGWTGFNMSGVKIHTHMLAQFLDGRRYTELTPLQVELLLIAVAALGLTLSWLFWHRRIDFLGLGVATVVLVAIDAAVFSGLRVILPFTLSLWAWFIGVTGGHHLRTIVERLRS